MIMSVLYSVLTYVCIVFAVAFFTLLERKGLSYIQIRKGPNKASISGIPQPLADAAKLLLKETLKPTVSNSIPFFVAPVFSFLLALMLWQLYPNYSNISYFKWGTMFFLCVSALNVYGTLAAGWSSNSKYALLGSLRSIAQTISYEISMALILLFFLFLGMTFSFIKLMEIQSLIWFLFLMLPVSFMWFVSCVAETNRAPFDFAEGESELVSGFNIEYGATGFALIFLAEYANILIMSLISSILFLGGDNLFFFTSMFLLPFKILLLAFVFIWVRSSYPRFRYDLLMNLTWKSFLPIILAVLYFLSVLIFML